MPALSVCVSERESGLERIGRRPQLAHELPQNQLQPPQHLPLQVRRQELLEVGGLPFQEGFEQDRAAHDPGYLREGVGSQDAPAKESDPFAVLVGDARPEGIDVELGQAVESLGEALSMVLSCPLQAL